MEDGTRFLDLGDLSVKGVLNIENVVFENGVIHDICSLIKVHGSAIETLNLVDLHVDELTTNGISQVILFDTLALTSVNLNQVYITNQSLTGEFVIVKLNAITAELLAITNLQA